MKFKISGRTAWRIIEGTAYLVLPEKNMLIKLNSTGTFLWKNIGSCKDTETLARSLSKKYDVNLKTARKDTSAFIKMLSKKGLLQICR